MKPESESETELQPWFYTTIDAIYELAGKPSPISHSTSSTAAVKKVVWKRKGPAHSNSRWPSVRIPNSEWDITIYSNNLHLLTRTLEHAVEKLQYIYDKNAKYYLQDAKHHQKMHEYFCNKDARQIVLGAQPAPTPTYISPFTGETQ